MASPLIDHLNFDLGFHVSSERLSVLSCPTPLAVLFGLPNNQTPGDMARFIPWDQATKAFREKGRKMLNDRQKLGKSRQDIFTHLLGEDRETGTAFTQGQLQASAELVIVAGTGPSASHPPHGKRRLKRTKSSKQTQHQ